MTKKIIAAFLCLMMAFGAVVPASAASFVDALTQPVGVAADSIERIAADAVSEDVLEVPSSTFFTTIWRTIVNLFRQNNPQVTNVKIKNGPEITLVPSDTKATYRVYYFDSSVSGSQLKSQHSSMPTKGDTGYVVVETSDGFVSKATKIKYIRPKEKYTLSFDANGGTGAPGSVKTNENGEVTIPLTVPAQENYYFKGWSFDKRSSETLYAPGTKIKISANKTLYAIWGYYRMTLDANGGKFDNGLTTDWFARTGKTTVLGGTPSKEGYYFTGWNTNADGSGISYITGENITVNKDMTLYAVWSTSYKVSGIFTYNESNASIEITGLTDKNYSGSIEIPEYINNKPVIRIANYAFKDCLGITSVNIPSGVAEIGRMAFMNCDGIAVFNVAAGNKNYSSVDGVLFAETERGTLLVQYPAGKTSVNTYILPCNLVYHFAFRNCKNIGNIDSGGAEINVYDRTESGGYSMVLYVNPFVNCSATVNGKNYVISGDYLVSWRPENDNPAPLDLTEEQFCDVRYIGPNACEGVTNLTSVTCGKNIVKICDSAFLGCTGLTEIQLNKRLLTIDKRAFEGCVNLETIVFYVWYDGDQPKSNMSYIEDYAFAYTKVPESSVDIIIIAGCKVSDSAFYGHIGS